MRLRERLAERLEGLRERRRGEHEHRLGLRVLGARWQREDEERGENGEHSERPVHFDLPGRTRRPGGSGSSITTLVALTTALASWPGASASSSAASRVISDTRRCGPAWISTCAATRSLVTRVMIPAKRLRADWRATASRAPATPCAAAKRASAAASTRRSPALVRRLASRPGVDPTPYGVGAHAEKSRDLAEPERSRSLGHARAIMNDDPSTCKRAAQIA